jgi:hypothetical protein
VDEPRRTAHAGDGAGLEHALGPARGRGVDVRLGRVDGGAVGVAPVIIGETVISTFTNTTLLPMDGSLASVMMTGQGRGAAGADTVAPPAESWEGGPRRLWTSGRRQLLAIAPTPKTMVRLHPLPLGLCGVAI